MNNTIINFIQLEKSPHFSIVTPLKCGDKISNETLRTVKDCEIPFNWISIESNMNVMGNFSEGFNTLKELKLLAPYVIKIDNDTEWKDGTLVKMHYSLKKEDFKNNNIAYTYCSFEYKGAINNSFPAIEFNKEKLKKGNYISSNSMFKSKVINDVGLVTDDQYVRLLDWAFLLKCLKRGYIGKSCEGFFTAYASKDSISTRSAEDYNVKRERVLRDFL
jgi:hypothetical protein